MPFGTAPRKEPKGKVPSPKDEEQAKRLATTLFNAHKCMKRPKIPTWADDIRLLRESNIAPSPERIERVLTYVISQVDRIGSDKDFPPIVAAKSFRTCFEWAERLMTEEGGGPPPEPVKPTDTSPEAKGLAAKFAHLTWPAEVDAAAFLHTVMVGYAAWRTKVRGLRDAARTKHGLGPEQSWALMPKGTDRDVVTAASVLLPDLKDPAGFACDLLLEEHRIAVRFGRCDLTKRVRKWREELDRLGYRCLARFGDPTLWKKLTKEVSRG